MQTVRPVPSSVHGAPRQQSVAEPHTAPIGRQGPGPGSHRPLVLSQTPQQCPGPPEWQSSPEPRHVATGSITHLPLRAAVVDVTLVRAALHVGGAAGPLAQALRAPCRRLRCTRARSSRSRACTPAPAGAHCGRQTSSSSRRRARRGRCSTPPRDVHAAPAGLHVPGRAHVPPAQWIEQQSASLLQAAPRAWQLADGARASHSGALASVPKPPASAPAASGPGCAASGVRRRAHVASSMSSGPQAPSAAIAPRTVRAVTRRVLMEARSPRRARPRG